MQTRGEPSFSRTRGPCRHPVKARCVRSRRGQRTRHRRIEASQELGTPWTLRDPCPDGDPDYQPQAHRLRVLDRREQTTGAGRGIAKRMQKKRRETGARDSECLIVPMKSGNSTRGNPPEERRHRVADPLEGHTAGASKPGPVFTKPQRIAGPGTPRASRTRDLTSRMPKWGKSGSVGAGVGDHPGDPASDRGGDRNMIRNKLTERLMHRRLQASRSAGAPNLTIMPVALRRRSEHACNCVLNEAAKRLQRRGVPSWLWTFHACGRDGNAWPRGQVPSDEILVDMFGTAVHSLKLSPFDA